MERVLSLRQGSVNDFKFENCFSKKRSFSTTSPHGEKEIHALLFTLLYRVEIMCILVFGILQHTIQNLFEGQGLASYALRLFYHGHWQGEEFMLHYANALQVWASC